ncbi:MAG: cytidylate kinase family protein [Candidatus Micrarchaeota archaeon]|nr:cytidylate kinase family protein [Candidatus Micrarchaeota archaeon]
MEAIVISGLPAAGKTVSAHAVSGRLGVPMIGGTDILKQMAMERGYKPGGEEWWDTSEGMRFLKERDSNHDFDKETDRRMTEIVKKGNVVVTSYTAPWIIKEGFKVWISASPGTRAERMAKRDRISVDESRKLITERDEKNRKLYMALYKIDFGRDIKPFHLVIESDKMSNEQVVNEILGAYKKRNK